MSGVEAAASLFGPEESLSDPFANLGTESSSADVFPTDNASNFLDSAHTDPYASQSFYAGDPPAQETSNGYNHPESTSDYFTYADPSGGSTYHPEWYGGLGQSQDYQPVQVADDSSLTSGMSFFLSST